MDAQFWIYIIIGIIYFLSKLLKKPEEQPSNERPVKPRPGRPAETATEEPRPLTFEELLREITEGKQPTRQEPKREPQPVAERPYRNFDEEIEQEEARSLERVDFDEAENARIFQKYEEAKAQATQRRSLEETLKLEDTVMDFKRFAAFERKESRNVLRDYINIVRDPEKLKHAVVMSEILKRKF